MTFFYVLTSILLCIIGIVLYNLQNILDEILEHGIHQTTSLSIREDSIKQIAQIVMKELVETYGVEIKEEEENA